MKIPKKIEISPTSGILLRKIKYNTKESYKNIIDKSVLLYFEKIKSDDIILADPGKDEMIENEKFIFSVGT